MKELAQALLAARKEMGSLVNNAKNPHYRSNYATLDEVIRVAEEPLANAGICVLEKSNYCDGVTLQLLSLFQVESGNVSISELPLICKDPSNPQQLKSAQTYARRMLWTQAAGLAPVDDDGNAAAQEPVKQPVNEQPADPLAVLKQHEAAIIAYAGSKGKIIAGVHELSTKQLEDPQGLIQRATEYAAQNTEVKS